MSILHVFAAELSYTEDSKHYDQHRILQYSFFDNVEGT